MAGEAPGDGADRAGELGRKAGIGCFATVVGFFSMAMVGALVSKMVASLMRAPACPDIPACDWYVYAGFFGAAGAISLPILVLRRLGTPRDPNASR
jgi:hypothetical protein